MLEALFALAVASTMIAVFMTSYGLIFDFQGHQVLSAKAVTIAENLGEEIKEALPGAFPDGANFFIYYDRNGDETLTLPAVFTGNIKVKADVPMLGVST